MSSKIPQEPTRATIDHLTPAGLGIANVGGRRTRIANGLPGEEVEFRYLRRHRGGDDGIAVRIMANSHPERVTPCCPHTGYCGGCSLQHLEHGAQVRLHQAHLEECLAAVGGPTRWLSPITDNAIHGYRRKARLGVKFVDKRDTVLVGFRERARSLVAEIESCAVLHPAVGERILELRTLIYSLDARHAIPQIEVAVGEEEVALIFRHIAPLSAQDQARLIAFASEKSSRLRIFLQPAGLDTITPLWPKSSSSLIYRLPLYEITIAFRPTDFTQVNLAVNRAMVEQAISLLEPQPGEAVLDLYCGLGNFSLPLARCQARVTGVEGDAGLVTRARENARDHALEVEFFVHDLNQGLPMELLRANNAHGFPYSKALLDPPRSGAAAVLPDLAALEIARIVYVSCNPETLSRDAIDLVRRHGYHLEAAGVIDMFPHTGHMESMAIFFAG
ncbi:23S rRNA (uracil(1939)-C(5))-methyltransferase RlmD [Gammaproteobacteria bacterium]